VQALHRAGKQAVVVLDVPELPVYPRDCITRPGSSLFLRRCTLDRSTVDHRQAALRTMLMRLAAEQPGMLLYDTTEVLCDQSICKFETATNLLYRDSHHLSRAGSIAVAKHLLSWLGTGQKRAAGVEAARAPGRPG
jgi:hypothetical protein